MRPGHHWHSPGRRLHGRRAGAAGGAAGGTAGTRSAAVQRVEELGKTQRTHENTHCTPSFSDLFMMFYVCFHFFPRIFVDLQRFTTWNDYRTKTLMQNRNSNIENNMFDIGHMLR